MPIGVFNPVRLYSHWQVFDQPVSWVGQLGGYFHYKQSKQGMLTWSVSLEGESHPTH